MNIIIENGKDIKFTCLNDLNKIIPNELNGEVVNYGQGEGQVEIEGTIWGIYCAADDKYTLQYEEGHIEWNQFMGLTNNIIDQLKMAFGSHLNFTVQGVLEHYEPHEKYTK